MKIKLLLVFILICFWGSSFSQVTPKANYTVTDSTALFVGNVSAGNTVFNAQNHKYYVCIIGASGTESLVTASAKFVEVGNSPWVRSGSNTILRTITDSVGMGTDTPTADFTLQGNVSYIPSIISAANLEDGISTTEMSRVLIYNSATDIWSNWSYGDPLIADGVEGQLLTLYSMGTGTIYLRNNNNTGTIVFTMKNGDNITMQYSDTTWVEVSRTDMGSATPIEPTAIEPLFGTAADSSLITTTIKLPIGYSNGIVIDTLVYITTSSGTVNITPKVYYGVDISSTGTAIITSPSAVTSKSTVTKVYSFNNGTIPRGNMMWLTFTSTTTKPKNFMMQIIGHKQ